MYGPKGVGALYVRRKGPRVRLAPMIDGGGHERGMRSGTVPVPLAVGFGRAAEICREVMPRRASGCAGLRDRLQDAILSKVDEAFLNGHPERRLPHNLNISFAYVEGESVLMGLNKEVALSLGLGLHLVDARAVVRHLGARGRARSWRTPRSGSACTGSPPRKRWTSSRARTVEVVQRLREMSPLYELAKEGVDLKSIQWKAE